MPCPPTPTATTTWSSSQPWSISIRAIPQRFWSHAVLIASKGSTSRIGSLSAGWERFFEWELVRQGVEAWIPATSAGAQRTGGMPQDAAGRG